MPRAGASSERNPDRPDQGPLNGSPPSRTSPSASVAAVHAVFGSFAMASRALLVLANPTEYSTVRACLLPWAVSQSSSPWEELAPSARTNRCLR